MVGEKNDNKKRYYLKIWLVPELLGNCARHEDDNKHDDAYIVGLEDMVRIRI